MRIVPNWAYASVAEFTAYLAGSVLSFDQGTDQTALFLRLLEAASRRVDEKLFRVFQPRTDVQAFDLGMGRQRYDRLTDGTSGGFAGAFEWGGNAFSSNDWPDYWVGGLRSGRRVALADWLLTPTTITTYADTGRTTSQVLAQGITNDYLLGPPDGPPYSELLLTERTNYGFGRGQQVLTVAGEWGWPYQLDTLTTISNSGGITSTQTVIPMTNGVSISVGMSLRVDSETMYVRSVSGANVTVRRGTSGTTAATHANGATVSQILYDSDLVELVEQIARLHYHARGQGATSITQDQAMTVVAYPGSEEKALLKLGLDHFKSKAVKALAF